METSARVAANRRNAAKSTGPRTEAGKKRAAKNALRHSLSLAVGALPELNPKVAELAGLIAGDDARPARLEAARRIADAHVDLQRVRLAKLLLLNGSKGKPPRRRWTVRDIREMSAILDLAGRGLGGDLSVGPETMARAEKLFPPPEIETESEKVAARIARGAKQLESLARYERRSLSRRKFAVRAFDELVEQRE
jgi:hypothetical protein